MPSKKFVNRLKERLTSEKQRLEEELKQFTQKNRGSVGPDLKIRFSNLGEKTDENAAEVTQFSNNLSLKDELEKALRDVTKALLTIEEGVYGLCKYCKNEINEKRLLARPTSSSCIKCKKTLTQEV